MNRQRKRAGWIESEEKRLRKLDERLGKSSSSSSKEATEASSSKAPSEEGDKQPRATLSIAKTSIPTVESTEESSETEIKARPSTAAATNSSIKKEEEEGGYMIEVVLNDRMGRKIKVKCNSDDTVGDLKKLAAAQTGGRPEKIRIQKWYTTFKDHIRLQDYEVTDGMNLELYYN